VFGVWSLEFGIFARTQTSDTSCQTPNKNHETLDEFGFLRIHHFCNKFSCQKNMQMIRSLIFIFSGRPKYY
jgi:hypothetical protein